MRLICPSCGATHSAEAWSSDADARQCIKIVGELPWDISRRVLAYLALFRPFCPHPGPLPEGEGGRNKGLRWAKALRLMAELAELTKETQIQWKGKPSRPCSSIAWGLALEKVIENPPGRLPLKSHGYLRAVAWEVADELDQGQDRARVKKEQSGQFRRGAPACAPELSGQTHRSAPTPEDERISQEEMKKISSKIFKKI